MSIRDLINKKGIFVTATGTDVGKTYVSALILKYLIENKINAGYFKPALSGAYYHDGELIAGDADYVLKVSGISKPSSECVGYMFEQAVSPHLAAELNSMVIDADIIMKKYQQALNEYDFVLVEGAGGIACPFRMGDNPLILIDIINTMGLKLLIISPSGVGAINSTVLTVEYARNHGAKIFGIIMNEYDKTNHVHIDNRKCIEQITDINVIATVETDAINLSLLI